MIKKNFQKMVVAKLVHTIESMVEYYVKKMGKDVAAWWSKRSLFKLIIPRDNRGYTEVWDVFINHPTNSKEANSKVFNVTGSYAEYLQPCIVEFEGHKITICQEVIQPTSDEIALGDGRTFRLILRCNHSVEVLERYVGSMVKQKRIAPVKTCRVFTATSGSGFVNRGSFVTTSIPRPILRKGLLNNIIEDAKEFQKNPRFYLDRGIPYRRGYCFYGPPGTGKSSLIAYIAATLHRDVHYIGAQAMKLAQLDDLVTKVGEYEILVIEDIDCMYNGREPLDHNLPKFNDLLNALDGLLAPKGVLVFITTNNLAALDKALVRPGRIDQVIELGYCDSYQIQKFVKRFFPESNVTIRPDLYDERFTPAQIQKFLMESATPDDFLNRISTAKISDTDELTGDITGFLKSRAS